MRLSGFMLAILFLACFNPPHAFGQGGDPRGSEEQLEPYHKHRDTRHGHDHSYPDRGAVLRELPRGTIGVNYAGVSYRYHDGIWFEPRGPAFVVVAPPIGLVVPTLPTFTTVLAHGGQTYLYVNDVYYRPRPDLGGYEVVNEPAESASQSAADAAVGTQPSIISAPQPQPAAAPQPATAALAASAAMIPPVATALPDTAAVPAGFTNGAVPAPATMGATPNPQARAAVPPVAAAPPVPPPPTLPAATASVPAAPTAAVALSTGPSQSSAPTTPTGPKVFAYPRNGQTSDQQARDRYECYRFAVAQSGFDPMRSSGGPAAPANGELQSDYDRAQGACFEGRGYTIR